MTTAHPAQSILLAAQPIYDDRDDLQGVELLYRNDLHQGADQIGDRRATSELIVNLCSGITDQVEHYQRPAFINVTADFLQSRAFLPLDPDQVVIELVERIRPTPELVEAVSDWHRLGFRFALDDFEFGDDWAPLLPYASIIKVDVLETDFEVNLERKRSLAAFDGEWLAERVEDQVTHERYRDAGFTLFQGYFLARPKNILGTRLTPSAIHVTQVINALFAEEPEWGEIVTALSNDPALTLSLIRIANSPLYRARHEIVTLDGVIRHLGLNHLRRWAALIASLNASSPAAARLVLARARFCQLLADRSLRCSVPSEQAFLVGLLSGSDVLLGIRIDALLDELDLCQNTIDALRDRRGPAGALLQRALYVERAVSLKTGLEDLDPRVLTAYRKVSDDVQQLFNELR